MLEGKGGGRGGARVCQCVETTSIGAEQRAQPCLDFCASVRCFVVLIVGPCLGLRIVALLPSPPVVRNPIRRESSSRVERRPRRSGERASKGIGEHSAGVHLAKCFLSRFEHDVQPSRGPDEPFAGLLDAKEGCKHVLRIWSLHVYLTIERKPLQSSAATAHVVSGLIRFDMARFTGVSASR